MSTIFIDVSIYAYEKTCMSLQLVSGITDQQENDISAGLILCVPRQTVTKGQFSSENMISVYFS